MKRIAIIDDEQAARQALRTMLGMLSPNVEVCGEAWDVEGGYLLLRNTRPHCVLLDISLEDGTGFELLDKFPMPFFQVIFTTAHDEFALKAFRYHAMDYLLKPVDMAELAQSIDRVQKEIPEDYPERISQLLDSTRRNSFQKIILHSQEGMIILDMDQIIHLRSEGSYTTFFLVNQEKHLICRSIKNFETLLPEKEFFRIHQSHIIRIAKVKKILRENGGYALMSDGYKVPIARRRKEEFLDVIRAQFSD